MISPKKIEYYKVMKNKKSSSISDSGIFEETKSIIKNLFLSLIDAEINTEAKKKRLISVPGFSNYECYEIIKGKFKSFILKEDVKLIYL